MPKSSDPTPKKARDMKKTILTLMLVSALLAGCTAMRKTADLEATRDDLSWTAFCADRGHSLHDRSPETINEYLDSWCGSADEEAVFLAAGLRL